MKITRATKEIEECVDRLLRVNKPKMIVAVLDDENNLTEQQVKHFKTAEYIWNLIPQTIEGPYKDKFMGLLLDESLDYVHIVFATGKFLDYVRKTKS